MSTTATARPSFLVEVTEHKREIRNFAVPHKLYTLPALDGVGTEQVLVETLYRHWDEQFTERCATRRDMNAKAAYWRRRLGRRGTVTTRIAVDLHRTAPAKPAPRIAVALDPTEPVKA